MTKKSPRYSASTFFIVGFLACLLVSKLMDMAKPAPRGPVFSSEVLREVLKKELDLCRVSGVSGSSGHEGEWVIHFKCPESDEISTVFNNLGGIKK